MASNDGVGNRYGDYDDDDGDDDDGDDADGPCCV